MKVNTVHTSWLCIHVWYPPVPRETPIPAPNLENAEHNPTQVFLKLDFKCLNVISVK